MSKSYKVAKKTINMGDKKGQTVYSVRPYSYGTLTTEEVAWIRQALHPFHYRQSRRRWEQGERQTRQESCSCFPSFFHQVAERFSYLQPASSIHRTRQVWWWEEGQPYWRYYRWWEEAYYRRLYEWRWERWWRKHWWREHWWQRYRFRERRQRKFLSSNAQPFKLIHNDEWF